MQKVTVLIDSQGLEKKVLDIGRSFNTYCLTLSCHHFVRSENRLKANGRVWYRWFFCTHVRKLESKINMATFFSYEK